MARTKNCVLIEYFLLIPTAEFAIVVATSFYEDFLNCCQTSLSIIGLNCFVNFSLQAKPKRYRNIWKNDTQCNDTKDNTLGIIIDCNIFLALLLSVVMLRIAFCQSYTQCSYAECSYAECSYAECLMLSVGISFCYCEYH
jgi:hypothetical protein